MPTVTGFDVTGNNYALRPKSGQIALYTTGGNGIAASPAMFAANPDAVVIDQSPIITAIDTTADAYDLETGAVTVAEIGQVIKDAWNNFNHAVRPGQRKPMVYMSASNLTPVANALVAAGTTASLWVAHWGVSLADATAQVEAATGPFPLDGFQYQDAGNYDLDVFSVSWLNARSSVTPIVLPPVKLWHGIFVGTQDGTTTKQGSSFVVPLVSADGGKTFKPTATGKGE